MIIEHELKRLRCTRAQLDYALVNPLVKINASGNLCYKISIFRAPVELLDVNDHDEMNWHIKCPYCGEITTIGDTKMISGYVGCNNCYSVSGGLLETVLNKSAERGSRHD